MIAAANIVFLLGLFIPFTTTDASVTEIPAGRRIWCYYTNWAQYRPMNMQYVVKDIDPHLCTHFSFAFAVFKHNLVKPYENNDDDLLWNEGMYTKFNKLRLLNPRLKTFLAIGGWNFGSALFSKMARSPLSRRTFIDSTVSFLRERNFDGLDLDWEYPANRNGSADDKENFSLLIKELYETFVEEAKRTNKPRLMMAIAVGAAKAVVDSAYDVPEINRFVDFFNIMSYDYHGSWENTTAHSSPLFAGNNEHGAQRFWNTAWSANYWVEKGASLDKINVGIPLYGRSFTLKDPKKHGVGAFAPCTGKKGNITRSEGFLAYFEVCEMLKNNGRRYYIEEQKVPYAVRNDQWVGYEDEGSVVAKTRWIMENRFRGVMVWTTDLDDYKGICGNGRYPLMRAINRVISEEFPLTKPHVVETTAPVIIETTSDGGNEFCKNRAFGVYPSPKSCLHFVLCMNDNYFLLQCQQNKEWNSTMGRCVPYGYGDCFRGSE